MRRLAWLSVLLLVGCASAPQMALNKQTKAIDVSTKSVVLMTLDLGRPEASRYIPYPTFIGFAKKTADGKFEPISFSIDDEAGSPASEVRNKFFLRMALEPGEYEMRTVIGNARAFPFVGFFQLPLLLNLNVPAKSVVYVGKVNALIRPRVGNEFRAGPVLPLIDQASTGLSGGTFDVSIEDAAQDDIAQFKTMFPVLASAQINKAILPPFDRDGVQYWWEHDGVAKTAANSSNIQQAKQ